MKSSDCGASKIISNEAQLEPISKKLNIENRLFSICVGVWVGGFPQKTFLKNSTSFDAYDAPATGRGKMLHLKTAEKFDYRGLKLG